MKAKDSITFLEWAPDSRHLVSATLSPRLRVDNNFKVWFFDGSLVTDMKFDGSELYEVKFSPFYVQTSLPATTSTPSTSSATPPTSTPTKTTTEVAPAPKPGTFISLIRNDTVGKYIPPNARNSSSGIVGASFTIDKGEEGPMKYSKPTPPQKQVVPSLPPGYTPETSRNKKRRSKKKNQKKDNEGKDEDDDDEETTENTSNDIKSDSSAKPPKKEEKKQNEGKKEVPSAQPPANVKSTNGHSNDSNEAPVNINAVLKGEEAEKKIKALSKKLRQIEDLKKQKESGKTLDANQVSKLASEQSIRDELNSLQKK